MKNYVQEGCTLTLTAPYARSSGEGAQVGTALFGVAVADVASGAEGGFQTKGVFDMAKVSAQAWTVGDKIYWDNTAKLCTTVSTSNLLVGMAVAAAANPSSTGRVKLTGQV